MLRLFRNMRKNLSESPRFISYMVYALGEIVLVVIGILIALQIDAWNKERELRQKEKIFLAEIHSNLQDDLDNVQYALYANKEKDSLISVTLRSILNSASNLEAMQAILQNMQELADFSIFIQNRVAFENMLSAESIDLITNDSLRIRLSDYYSVETLTFGTQDRVRELTRVFVDHIAPMLTNRETNMYLFNMESDFVSAEELNFRTNRTIFADLYSMQRTMDSHKYFLMDYERSITDLLGRIDQFLAANPRR